MCTALFWNLIKDRFEQLSEQHYSFWNYFWWGMLKCSFLLYSLRRCTISEYMYALWILLSRLDDPLSRSIIPAIVENTMSGVRYCIRSKRPRFSAYVSNPSGSDNASSLKNSTLSLCFSLHFQSLKEICYIVHAMNCLTETIGGLHSCSYSFIIIVSEDNYAVTHSHDIFHFPMCYSAGFKSKNTFLVQ